MDRVKDILQMEPEEQTLAVNGWIRTKRDNGSVIFMELSDGSCLKNLQLVLDRDIYIPEEEQLKRCVTGASVRAEGVLIPSEGKNQKLELSCRKLDILGDAPGDYPLQKKRHSPEFLREIAHLRPRTNLFGAVTRIRSELSYAVHTFFKERDFYYIHTPIITGSDAEGAGQMFQVTTLDLDKASAWGGPPDYKRDFFGTKSHLTVSGQLQVENFACALGNVYTFGPTFRAENSNTSRHLAEFWMIEPEMAFCDLSANMDTAEDFIKSLLRHVLENCSEDMDFFNRWVEKGLMDNLRALLEKPFSRMTYTEAISKLQKSGENFEYKPEWGCDLQTEHERYLTEKIVGGAVFVTDYPAEIKAFYMKQNPDGKTVRAMDLLVPRLGEIIGGSQREEDFEKLQSRIRSLGMDPEDYWWYLDLRRYGTVPHAGFGLGFERLIQYVTGVQNIRDVIPFPRYVKHNTF